MIIFPQNGLTYQRSEKALYGWLLEPILYKLIESTFLSLIFVSWSVLFWEQGDSIALKWSSLPMERVNLFQNILWGKLLEPNILVSWSVLLLEEAIMLP